MAHQNSQPDSAGYEQNSLSLRDAVALGLGVMVGAGILTLTGQIAEAAGSWMPWVFLLSAAVTACSAHAYVRLSNVFPSAGGIAMFLVQAYGKGAMTAGCGLLMYVSMVVNEALVARTFGIYVLQWSGGEHPGWWVPALGVGLVVVAFGINLASNDTIGRVARLVAWVKVGGIALFALGALWLADRSLPEMLGGTPGDSIDIVAALALGILSYKGFTTITNSGSEIRNPHQNVGRAIVISLAISAVVYLLVAFAVMGSLSSEAIIDARDYALAEAARPLLGGWGGRFTVLIAVLATVSGIIASMFAVSRMLAMLTDMQLVPDVTYGAKGRTQFHTLITTALLAVLVTALFDVARIAALGAFFYIVMDIAVQWGVWRHLRKEVRAIPGFLILTIWLNVVILCGLGLMKWRTDPLILWLSLGGIALLFLLPALWLKRTKS